MCPVQADCSAVVTEMCVGVIICIVYMFYGCMCGCEGVSVCVCVCVCVREWIGACVHDTIPGHGQSRSEERRVGTECSSRGSPYHIKRK